MNLKALNKWLILAANLGVVLGLAILIFELRQTAALSRASLEIEKNSLLANIELSLAEPERAAAWVKSIRNPEAMTDVEARIVESHLVAVMMQWDYLFQMQAIGLVEMERVVGHIRNTAPYYFGSRHGKHWFQSQASGWEGTEMLAVAGPIIAELDTGFLESYLDDSRLDDGTEPGEEE